MCIPTLKNNRWGYYFNRCFPFLFQRRTGELHKALLIQVDLADVVRGLGELLEETGDLPEGHPEGPAHEEDPEALLAPVPRVVDLVESVAGRRIRPGHKQPLLPLHRSRLLRRGKIAMERNAARIVFLCSIHHCKYLLRVLFLSLTLETCK